MAKAIKKLFIYSNMAERKQLNVRIPLYLQQKIDNDGRPKVDIVIEALELYFANKKQGDDSLPIDSTFDNGSAAAKDNSANASKRESSVSKTDIVDSNDIAGMKNETEYLRSKVDDLIKLLHQEQILHIQTQHMLAVPEKSLSVRKWWQFWK